MSTTYTKRKPRHYVCTLTADGYQYLDHLQEFNATVRDDDRLCNNKPTKTFKSIYKWTPDNTNFVEQQINEYQKLYADELKEIAESFKYPEKKPKIKTQKQLRAAYRRKLRQTIKQSIKEVQNELHRQK